mgnify:FL=1
MKNKIRKEILALRKAMPIYLLEENSRIIAEKVITHPKYQAAELVFAYIDAKGEVITKDIIEHAWSNNKRVVVPKVQGDRMEFYEIASYHDLEPGCFGIMEPKITCMEITDIPKNSVVIMPGVAFDKTGNRIGYGKGYYDKYFSKYPDLCKIAIAFSLQIVSEIQADKFDVKADCVITESVIYE